MVKGFSLYWNESTEEVSGSRLFTILLQMVSVCGDELLNNPRQSSLSITFRISLNAVFTFILHSLATMAKQLPQKLLSPKSCK